MIPLQESALKTIHNWLNLEVEKWDASPERAEFHVATMCMENLRKNEEFSKLPEIYVIFI